MFSCCATRKDSCGEPGDFKPHSTGNINGVPHGHIMSVLGQINTGHVGDHIPFMLINFK